MEKPMVVGKYCCNNPIWFVILSSFVFCLILFLLDLSTLTTNFNFAFPNLLDHEKPKSLYSYTSPTTNITNNFPGSQSIPNQDHPIDHSDPVYRLKFTNNVTQNATTTTDQNHSDSCSGRYIYVYDLPSQFNVDLVKKCHGLIKWIDMCPYLSNEGFGTKLEVDNNSKSVLMENGWFLTSQFSLEVIFHNRMNKYRCLTNDSSMASAIFVPYYAGLDVGQYLWNLSMSLRDRDSLPRKLVDFLGKTHEWKTMWGRDHFLIGGRIAWDFRRLIDDDKNGWGSKLMLLPESNNMTLLSIESSWWNNDFAIPYPTYFHPSKESELLVWQERVRKRKRSYMFSFAGGPRPGSKDSIRGELINHCKSSAKLCKFMACHPGSDNECEDPVKVMELFQNSIFCLQPSGDSFTRRSTFDSILAGCIPVFFNPISAYTQYLWHLPKNYSSYSVFIPQSDVKEKRVLISERLLGVSEDEVLEKREKVIGLIPRIIYGDWSSSSTGKFEDAFDIAVKGLLGRVEKVRKKIKQGEDPSEGFAEENQSKFDLLWKKSSN
ncbi:hypothetical protein FNV43_RR01369 [Rhamnella rubrinervis]|uniref:Exostosin GT47 domain-containing protein n=1 Tax=Rhamnella rubrinervis TaxID=2594499 RepID=A0A8K0HQD6_9ROSA|nr:hypothetical protein FNV43_RR01369 [Rhamnella rubrinervis]